MAHTFNPSTRDLCEFDESLIYRASSRTGLKATEKGCLKKQKNKQQKWSCRLCDCQNQQPIRYPTAKITLTLQQHTHLLDWAKIVHSHVPKRFLCHPIHGTSVHRKKRNNKPTHQFPQASSITYFSHSIPGAVVDKRSRSSYLCIKRHINHNSYNLYTNHSFAICAATAEMNALTPVIQASSPF